MYSGTASRRRAVIAREMDSSSRGSSSSVWVEGPPWVGGDPVLGLKPSDRGV